MMDTLALALYLSLTGGGSFTNGPLISDPPGSPPNSAPFKSAGYSPNIRGAVGLSFGRWDIELGGGVLGKWQINRDLSHGGLDSSGTNFNANEIDIRVRYNQPIGRRWYGYVEGGAAAVNWHQCQWRYSDTPFEGEGHNWAGGWHDSSGWELTPQVGAGIGYDLSKHWRLTGGFTYTPVRDYNVTQVMVGVRWQP